MDDDDPGRFERMHDERCSFAPYGDPCGMRRDDGGPVFLKVAAGDGSYQTVVLFPCASHRRWLFHFAPLLPGPYQWTVEESL